MSNLTDGALECERLGQHDLQQSVVRASDRVVGFVIVCARCGAVFQQVNGR